MHAVVVLDSAYGRPMTQNLTLLQCKNTLSRLPVVNRQAKEATYSHY